METTKLVFKINDMVMYKSQFSNRENEDKIYIVENIIDNFISLKGTNYYESMDIFRLVYRDGKNMLVKE